jgi:hypothetical protein
MSAIGPFLPSPSVVVSMHRNNGGNLLNNLFVETE